MMLFQKVIVSVSLIVRLLQKLAPKKDHQTPQRTCSVPNLKTVPPNKFHCTVILVATEPSMLPAISWAIGHK